jgi:acyl phosphate:glycerol-3-phosphate acyltransferase
MSYVLQAALILAGYLLGSMPWGFWISRRGGIDIRTIGSGNTGATNVWRAFGPRLGVPVLILDMLKGAVPAVAGLAFFGSGTAVLAGSAAIVGHTLPIFLGFGGGKGVATAAGMAFVLAPLAALILVVVFLAVLWMWRYVSLASMTIAVLIGPVAWILGSPWPVVAWGFVVGVLVVARHHANLRRLFAGTEAKAKTFGRGAKRSAASPPT